MMLSTLFIINEQVPIFYKTFQAGLILTINVLRTAVCGATIISDTRILSGAHCYNDGNNVVQTFTVVLGSNLLFSGGTRIVSNDVVLHPGYNPWIAANDLAIIRVSRISFSSKYLTTFNYLFVIVI